MKNKIGMNPNFAKSKFIQKYKQPTLAIKFKIIKNHIKQMFKDLRYPTIDDYNIYPLVHIWGNHPKSNFFTMDDICIVYNVETNMYHLLVETGYLMDGPEAWYNYLLNCLQYFTEFMEENGFNIDTTKGFFGKDLSIDMKAPSIEELYGNFVLFVNAFCVTCEDDEDFEDCEEYDEDDDDDEDYI